MKCVVCNKTDGHTMLEGIPNPRKVGNPFYRYFECNNCKLWMLEPFPGQDILTKIYNENYNLYENVSDNLPTKVMNLLSKNRITTTTNYCKSGQKLLDVGCGNGSFLFDMKNRNVDVYGTEWSEYAAGLAKKRLQLDTIFSGDIPNLPWTHKFDCITAWHVLEHNPDPNHFILSIKEKLIPSGYFIIEVPNAESEVLKRTGNKYPWFSIPEHVTYWSDSSLRYLAEQNRFKVIISETPFAMPFLYAKATTNTMRNKLKSIQIQWTASQQKKGDILRQVWQSYE